MSNDKYLRGRPFFVVKVIQRPARGVRTETKGWGDNPENWAMFEDTGVVDRVNTKLVREASIIIDLLHKSCIVNNAYPDTEKSVVADYYINKYQTQIAEAMDIWLARKAAAAA